MSVVKDVINSINPTEENAAKTKECLQLLYELSEQKANAYIETIKTDIRTAGTEENKTIPVKVLLGKRSEIRATSSTTTDDDITAGIGDSLKAMLTGTEDGIIEGLKKLVNSGLQAILGCAEGEERETQCYYVCTDGLSIVRLDIIHWCRNITAVGITDKVEKSIVSVAVKSSVDLEKIDFNAFLSVYQAQLAESGMNKKELIEALDYAREVYHKLVDPENSDTLSNNLITDIKPAGILSYSCKNNSDPWPC